MSLDDFVVRAFGESAGEAALTSRHLRVDEAPTIVKLITLKDSVLAARRVLEVGVRMFAPNAEIHWQFADGDALLAGQVVGWMKVPLGAVLTAEPVVLDLLGRAADLARRARHLADAVSPGPTRVVGPVRATTGWAELEHAALLAGGAEPSAEGGEHRLSAGFARAAGSIAVALEQLRLGYAGPVAVECETLEDVEGALRARAARVELTPAVDLAAARALVPRHIPLEVRSIDAASAVRALAAVGVDRVRAETLTVRAAPDEFNFQFESPRSL